MDYFINLSRWKKPPRFSNLSAAGDKVRLRPLGMDNVIRMIYDAPDALARGLKAVGEKISEGAQWVGDKEKSGAESVKKEIL